MSGRRKGKVVKVCGVKVYKEFEKKSIEERGKTFRPAVYRSGKEYNRQKAKKIGGYHYGY